MLKLQIAVLYCDIAENVVESISAQLPSFISAQESIRNHPKAIIKLNDRNDETILRIIELEERLKVLDTRLNETPNIFRNILKFEDRTSQLEDHQTLQSSYIKLALSRYLTNWL